eukprot:174190-Pleurochrysis_carterae.AAC.1
MTSSRSPPYTVGAGAAVSSAESGSGKLFSKRTERFFRRAASGSCATFSKSANGCRVLEKWSGALDWVGLRAGVLERESGSVHLQRMSEGPALLLEKKRARDARTPTESASAGGAASGDGKRTGSGRLAMRGRARTW